MEHLDGNFENNRPENLVNCKKWINVDHRHLGVNHVACDLLKVRGVMDTLLDKVCGIFE